MALISGHIFASVSIIPFSSKHDLIFPCIVPSDKLKLKIWEKKGVYFIPPNFLKAFSSLDVITPQSIEIQEF